MLTIITNVQIGKYSYYPTSGLKQVVQIDKKGKRKIVDVKIYMEGNITNNSTNNTNITTTELILTPIIKNKTYIMASTSYLLSEESGDDFRVKKVLRIIKEKFKSNKIKCEKTDLGLLLVNYFQDKEIVNISKEVNLSNPRIIVKK